MNVPKTKAVTCRRAMTRTTIGTTTAATDAATAAVAVEVAAPCAPVITIDDATTVDRAETTVALVEMESDDAGTIAVTQIVIITIIIGDDTTVTMTILEDDDDDPAAMNREGDTTTVDLLPTVGLHRSIALHQSHCTRKRPLPIAMHKRRHPSVFRPR